MHVLRKLRALFFRRDLDAEMSEEMRLHLELQTEAYVARGMSSDDARNAALKSFGGVEQVKETARAQRGWAWLEQLLQDLRFGARVLVKNPGFTSVAVLSLAIGIGLNTAVFSIINTVFYQTVRGVPEPGRVMYFNSGTSPEGFGLLREAAADVMAVNASHRFSAVIQVRSVERNSVVDAASGNYFSVLRQAPVRGRFFSPPGAPAAEPHEPEVVLEHGFWERELGGDPAILGEVVRINRVSFTVVGVVHGTGVSPPPFLIPLGALPLVRNDSGGGVERKLGLLGRLRPGVTRAQAQAALDVITAREPDVFGATSFRLSAGREDWRGEESAEKRAEKLLVTVVPLVVVAALLWIACSNVSNLLLARAVQRQREIAVRVASGASRARLIRMMMAESLILALLGGAAGLWVSGAALDFIFATLSEFGALNVQVDGHVLLYTAGVCVLATLSFGLVPALRASRVNINAALKGEASHASFRPLRLRRFLLASQIASSIALLIVAGTFVKTLIAQLYAGGQAKVARELLIAQIPADHLPIAAREEFLRATTDRLRALPGSAAVTLMEAEQRPPLRLPQTRAGEPAAGDRGPTPRGNTAAEIHLQAIDAHYFQVVPVTLQRGTALPETAATGWAVADVLANEAAVELLARPDDPLGRVVGFENGAAFRVVGVVRDASTRATLYTRLSLAHGPAVQAAIRTRGDAGKAKAGVLAALRDPGRPSVLPRVATYQETALRGTGEITRIACFVGGLALLLAASGIYGSAAFSAAQRTREIGVRLALGATRRDVFRLMLGDAFGTVAWGVGIGMLAGMAGLGALTKIMFGQWTTDGGALLAVVVFFAFVAFLAACWPARRATKVDPMLALRAE